MVVPLWALNTINKFVISKKVDQSSPNFFKGCYPLRTPIMPNFIKIGQTSLEKSVKKRYSILRDIFFCLGRTET